MTLADLCTAKQELPISEVSCQPTSRVPRSLVDTEGAQDEATAVLTSANESCNGSPAGADFCRDRPIPSLSSAVDIIRDVSPPLCEETQAQAQCQHKAKRGRGSEEAHPEPIT